MHIYILGVEARFRGNRLLETIRGSGHPHEIVWGEDASNKTERLSYISRRLSKVVNSREISVGEYCCAIGHQRILKNFLDSGDNWALILEEDANILHGISPIEELTKEWNGPTILHLGGIDQILRSTNEESFWLSEAHSQMHQKEEIVLFRVVGNVFGAFGFLINREAAEIAVQGNKRLRFPQIADWPSTWRYRIKFLITDKAFVSVETNGSELNEFRSTLSGSMQGVTTPPLIIKFCGWIKLLQNILLIEPAMKSLLGVNFFSVIHENLYLYVYSRILFRLRSNSQYLSGNK